MAEVSPGSIRDALENWSARPGPLYRRLAEGLRSAIEAARLAPGMMLPPERSLAATLAVSRSTVVAAFEELKRTGYLEARQGSGTWVRGRVRAPDEGNIELVEELESHAIVRNITGSPSETIQFTAASVDCAPEVNEAVLSLDPHDLAQWSAGHGYAPQGVEWLRKQVASYLDGIGLPTSPDQVLITSGATQAIMLASRLYIEPRSVAVVETPSYGGAIDMLHTAGARLFTIEMDAEGACTDQLAHLFERVEPRLVYIVPDFHNPTGIVMSAARRAVVALLASEFHVPVVEDLALRELWFGEPPPPPIASYAPDAPILTVGTMSKVFWAGLRVGWIRASEPIIARLARLKVVSDFGSPIMSQAIAARLLPMTAATAQWRRAELQERLAVLRAAGAEHLPDWEFNNPAGGLAVWAKLPSPRAEDLAHCSGEHGVDLVPGFAFAVDHRRHPDRLRLPFVAAPRVIEEGVRRMAEAWASLQRDAPEAGSNANVA